MQLYIKISYMSNIYEINLLDTINDLPTASSQLLHAYQTILSVAKEPSSIVSIPVINARIKLCSQSFDSQLALSKLYACDMNHEAAFNSYKLTISLAITDLPSQKVFIIHF